MRAGAAAAAAVMAGAGAGAPEGRALGLAGGAGFGRLGEPPEASVLREEDPVGAFTLYGKVAKQYVAERLDQFGRVVGRDRGFTAEACTRVVKEGTKGPDQQCRRVVGDKLKSTCASACESACAAAVADFKAREKAETGFTVEGPTVERVGRQCSRSCRKECTKPGEFSFWDTQSR